MSDLPAPRLATPRFQAARSIIALILREMSATYGRSPGGYLWAVLGPLGMILFLSLGHQLLIRTPPLGTSFLLFYAAGYSVYSLYGELAAKGAQAIRYSRALLAYPRVTWLDSVIARVLLAVLTKVTVFAILMSAVLAVVETHAVLDIRKVLEALAVVIVFGTAVGLTNCLLGGLFPVWNQIWNILSRPTFLASGVIYIYEDLPPVAQNILWYNPVLQATGLSRSGFFSTYDAAYVSLPYCFGVSLTLLALALLFMRRYYLKVLEA
jgi:capsular polysaccharide transport system permease protein